jgi:hypothetical protein
VPVAADVDLDGYTEVVVPAHGGIRVFGFDGVWGPARPLWNQLNYHITNINDDLSVPFSEVNSWEVHNTYRAQWPDSTALPIYDVTLTHTVGITGVTVLTDTFSVPPGTAADPLYGWDYTQTWADTVITRTFDSVLTDLRPGEARLVAQGTAVSYTLPSGLNQLQLPPLYASVPHIVAVSPPTQTVGAGGTAVYDVVLSNPAASADTYTLSVAGLPAEWLTYPPTVPLAAGAAVTVSLAVAVPTTAGLGENPFVVSVTNGSGGADQAGASLLVIDGLDVAIDPPEQTAGSGTPVTYTLTLTNLESVARTYDLAAGGLAAVTLPPTVTVAANSSATFSILVVVATSGPHPFTISASSNAAGDSDSAILNGVGDWGVEVALSPGTAAGGPGTPAVFTFTVTNISNLSDTYDLSASLPAGWSYRLIANGNDISSISLMPHVFNVADLRLLVTPALTVTAGFYDFSVTAQSQGSPVTTAVVTATVQVLPRGVQVAISPARATLDPTDTGVWQVTITNTGSVADSYWLTATGIIALSGHFSSNPVSLAPGQSAGVQLSADAFEFALPTTYEFAVVATSQNDDRIQNEDTAEITFTEYEAAEVAWRPDSQTVTDTLSATFLLVITNTGNVNTTYQFSLDMPGLTGQLPLDELGIPAHMAAAVPVTLEASRGGTYTIVGTATSAVGTTASATATLIVEGGTPAGRTLYLPIVVAKTPEEELNLYLPIVMRR